jgi:hypothetical protein
MSKTGTCDFCGKRWDPMDHTWFCHHAKPFSVQEQDTGTIYQYDDEWLVCETCDTLVATDNRKALALRSAETHPNRKPGNLRELFALMEFLHEQFFSGWLDSHPLYERRECLTRLPNVQ